MVKKNYAAWQINHSDFSDQWTDIDKLKFFARYAILAPSGHNTQPWRLTAKNQSIEVEIDKNRHLSIDGSGLLSVEPYISVGTFLEVYKLAAEGFGYKVQINLFPTNKTVAKISIKDKILARPRLLEAITSRVSNRNTFEKTAIDDKILREIASNNLTGIKTTLLTDRSDINFVSGQTAIAIRSIMGNPGYREELSRWVRTNHTNQYEGMPGFTHGFGNLKSLLSKVAVKRGAKLGPQAEKSKKLIEESAALIIIRCTDDKKESFINAGRIYSQICVLAQNYQIASSALGASVLDPLTREKIKENFGIKDRPIYIIRLGKAKVSSRHSPRWPLELILNQSDA